MIRPKVGSYVVYEPEEEGWEEWDVQFRQINDDLRTSAANSWDAY